MWRVVTHPKTQCTLRDLEFYSLNDLADAHDVIDMLEQAESKLATM